MNAISTLISTLIAVAVGSLMTYMVTAAGERARWKREQSARWDLARMDAYFAYAHALKATVHVAIRIGVARGLGTIVAPLGIDEGLAKLAAMEIDRGALWEKVLLVGDPQTIEAGRDWHERAWQLGWFAEGRVGGADAWDATIEAAEQARRRFYECARRNLNVPGGTELPVSGWTRRQGALSAIGTSGD